VNSYLISALFLCPAQLISIENVWIVQAMIKF